MPNDNTPRMGDLIQVTTLGNGVATVCTGVITALAPVRATDKWELEIGMRPGSHMLEANPAEIKVLLRGSLHNA